MCSFRLGTKRQQQTPWAHNRKCVLLLLHASLILKPRRRQLKICCRTLKIVTRIESLTVHSPDLHLPVVGSRHDEGHAGVEGCPVDAAVMTLDAKKHTQVREIKTLKLDLKPKPGDYVSRSAHLLKNETICHKNLQKFRNYYIVEIHYQDFCFMYNF